MSLEFFPHVNIGHEPERERELHPVISYDAYRELCDESQPEIYRRTGIDSQENYEEALNSPATVYIEKDNQRLPLLVSLENAGGYNIENSQRLTGKDKMFALVLPPALLNDSRIELSEYLQDLGDRAAVIVQSGADRTLDIKSRFSNDLASIGWGTGEFLDPRCPKGRQEARISMYETHLRALDNDGVLIPRSDERPLEDLFIEDVERTGEVDTELVTAEMIRENDGLFEQLWQLHNDRFDWLGEYHPVSMQETKDFFRYVVTNDHTISYVRFDYENGERVPVCHGCFMNGLDEAEWLTDDFRQEINQAAADDQEKVQYFYGIVSKSTTSAHYAKDVMQLHSRLSKKNGGGVKMLFESTNKSSLYIPRMVQSYLGQEHDGTKATEVQSLSQLDYWYLASVSSETV
jgi:hypothetical protein